jgi:hypothetical protein
VFRSADTAKKWTAASGGAVPYSTYALIKRKNTLYAGTFSLGIFQAADSSVVEWKRVDTSSHDFIPAFAKRDTVLYAATPHGVLMSDDGISWATCGTGLENTAIRSLAATENVLLAGTAKRGVWIYPFVSTQVPRPLAGAGFGAEYVRRIGKKILIHNPGTVDATVAIVKVNGALVRSIVVKKGMTSIIDDFSKSGYAAGVYFIAVKIRGAGLIASRVVVP